MIGKTFFAVIFLVCAFGASSKPMSNEDTETLELVHVIFRHGDRTNIHFMRYPKDPHYNETYEPYGLGELTKKGKTRMYRLGKALRERYAKFLGKSYHQDILEATSSDSRRTKVSLLLVLASLFPPNTEEMWDNNLHWQPIPYSHTPTKSDKVFFGLECPTFKKLFKKQMASPKVQEELQTDQGIFEKLSKHTGLNITDYESSLFLYLYLKVQEEWGLKLPAWTKEFYPDTLKEFAIRDYEISTSTTSLRQLASGYLLQKIVQDSKAKVNGTLTPLNRKIILYSGHELNIAFMLSTLNIFKRHIPPYGSYIIFEIHNIKGVPTIKIFYQDYTTREPQLMKLPACDSSCPMDQFLELVDEYLPKEDICGNEN